MSILRPKLPLGAAAMVLALAAAPSLVAMAGEPDPAVLSYSLPEQIT